MADTLDYLREVASSLEDAGAEEEALLMARAVEELGSKILLVAADQRGSKILEKLLRKGGAAAFTELFKPLVEATAELAPNQYGSHVLEAALASWTERLGATPDAEPEGGEAAWAAGAPGPPPVEPLVAMCKSLEEEGAWPALVDNACASHVVRSLLLALGGFSPDPAGKGKAAARAGLLPERRHEVPSEVAECRRSVAGAVVALLREDPELCLNAHASAAVQVLLRVLRDRGDRGLVAEAVAAIVGADEVGGKPSAERCEALIRSAPGSRVLEVAVEVASAETFGELFSGVFRPRLRAMATWEEGDFGPFLVQRVADGLRDGPQLTLALADLDLEALLSAEAHPAQHAVVVKLLEASLRLNTAQKQLAAEVFRALNLRSADEHPRAWPALLLLDNAAEGPNSLLAPPTEKGKGWRKGAGKGGEASGEAGGGEARGEASSQPPRLTTLPTAGPLVLTTLLRFPGEAVEPINSGLPKLLGSREVLRALAVESRTARVIEAALAPTSALLPKARLRVVRAFQGLLGELGPHPVGGWVIAAIWKAALGEAKLREELAKELLEVEETLRTQNWAVWKVCGLYQAKEKKEEFARKQQKAGKTKALFEQLLEGGNAEAAKASAAGKVRSQDDAANREVEAQKRRAAQAVRSDPMVASLLGAGPVHAADEAVEGTGEVASGDGAPRSGDGVPRTHAAAREIDELFSEKPKKRRKQAEGEEEVEQAAAAAQLAAAAAATAGAPPKDADLAAALDIVAGREDMTKRERRKQNQRARAAAKVAARAAAKKAGCASTSSSESEAPASVPTRGGKRKGVAGGAGAAKKRMRPNFTR